MLDQSKITETCCSNRAVISKIRLSLGCCTWGKLDLVLDFTFLYFWKLPFWVFGCVHLLWPSNFHKLLIFSGDVVICRSVTNPEQYICKRVVQLEGCPVETQTSDFVSHKTVGTLLAWTAHTWSICIILALSSVVYLGFYHRGFVLRNCSLQRIFRGPMGRSPEALNVRQSRNQPCRCYSFFYQIQYSIWGLHKTHWKVYSRMWRVRTHLTHHV